MIDIIGHIGYLLIALGIWRLSKLDNRGWLLRFAGELVWVVIGVILNMTSITAWGLIFMAIDGWSYYKWRKAGI